MIELPIKHQITKTLTIRENGRSADWIAPNIILGCNAGCANSYCYVRRFDRKFIYSNSVKEVNDAVLKHSLGLGNKVPNQTDSKYWTYDICEASDLVRHWKDADWETVLNFYNETPNIKGTFATKFAGQSLLKIKPTNNKLRVRFSLMPQILSDRLEPNTSTITQKLNIVEKLESYGWEVHFNFSPVVLIKGWVKLYTELFRQIKERSLARKCEVIFLTHNQFKHNQNLLNGFEYEQLLWCPEIQEEKISEYGGLNIRYNHVLKTKVTQEFKDLYTQYFDLQDIRYIF